MYYMEFKKYTNFAKLLQPTPSDDDLLYLYARYKQVTIGDCNISEPNSFINRKNYYKWNAWNAIVGMEKTVAEKEYIEKVKELYK